MNRHILFFTTLIIFISSCSSTHHNIKPTTETVEESDFLFNKYYWVSFSSEKPCKGKSLKDIDTAISFLNKREIEVIRFCNYEQVVCSNKGTEEIIYHAVEIKLQDLNKALKLGWRMCTIKVKPEMTP